MNKLIILSILFFSFSCAHKEKKRTYHELKAQCENKNWEACYLFASHIRHVEPERYKLLMEQSCHNGFKEACPSKHLYLSRVQGADNYSAKSRRSPASQTKSGFANFLDIANTVSGYSIERAAHKNNPRFLGVEKPFLFPY